MEKCIFCKIISGEIPSRIVRREAGLIAFEDTNPVAPTHLLIVPRKHVATLNDASLEETDLLGRMVLCARDIAAERELSKEGYRLVMNCMPGAGQSVFHIHLHLLGGRPFGWPPG